MIIDSILLVLQGIIELLLSPLTVINITIDFIGSIPVIAEFIQVVAYVLPWSNILPLIFLVIALFVFRVVLAIVKLIWHFIPILGN